MLRFKIDENLPLEIANLLNEAGHDAETVWSEQIQGCSDSRILELCNSEKRVLVTLDMDFSDIRRYPPENYAGIIVIRTSSQSKDSVLALCKKMIEVLQHHTLAGCLWIVQPDAVRIRGIEK